MLALIAVGGAPQRIRPQPMLSFPPGLWNKLWRDWDTSSKDGSPQGCSTWEPLPGSLNYPWVLKDGIGILQSSGGIVLVGVLPPG